MDKRTFQQLTAIRIREARTLLNAGEYSGAYYLAGYAVESGLKAIVVTRFKRNVLPDKKLVLDVYTHNLRELVTLALLDLDFNLQMNNQNFEANWRIVLSWNESKRYSIITQGDATAIINALTTQNGGILRWIRSNW